MNHFVNEIISLERSQNYEAAYILAEKYIFEKPSDGVVIVKSVIKLLRGECMSLACNKTTEFSRELQLKEKLYKKLVLLIESK